MTKSTIQSLKKENNGLKSQLAKLKKVLTFNSSLHIHLVPIIIIISFFCPLINQFSFFDQMSNHILIRFSLFLQNYYFVNLFFQLFLKSVIFRTCETGCLD